MRRRFVAAPVEPSEGETWLRGVAGRPPAEPESRDETPRQGEEQQRRPPPAPHGARDSGTIPSSADDVLRDAIAEALDRPRGWRALWP